MAVYFDPPLVIGDDRVADRQAKAGAAAGRFRRIEWLEDLRHLRAWDSVALIRDLDHDRLLARPSAAGPHENGSARVHRIHGVEEQRHEDLDELLGVAVRERGGFPIELPHYAHALESLVMLQEKQRFLEHGIHVDRDLRRRLGTAEIEKAIDDALAAMHFGVDDAEIVVESLSKTRIRMLLLEAQRHALGAGTDRRQRVVHFVHDARGKLANGRKLLRLGNAILRRSPIGHVLADGDDVRDVHVIDAHRNLRDAEGAEIAGGTRLHLERRDLAGGEHVVELAPQQLGRLSMEDLEDRPSDRFFTGHALNSRLALAVPGVNPVFAIDDVEP